MERSFQDPTVVITTYEGQHNHPIPTNLRGNSAAAAMYSDFMTPRSFTHDMFRTAAYTSGGSVEGALDYGYGQSGYGSVNANPNSSHQNYHQGGEYELLKEILPSIFFKQEHWSIIAINYIYIHLYTTYIYIEREREKFQYICNLRSILSLLFACT